MAPANSVNGTAANGSSAPPLDPDFELLFSLEYESVPVQMAKHTPTGMHVFLAQVKSPCVHGYFCVHTEDTTDYGYPHTLEHLIFMGSSGYPYKVGEISAYCFEDWWSMMIMVHSFFQRRSDVFSPLVFSSPPRGSWTSSRTSASHRAPTPGPTPTTRRIRSKRRAPRAF